MRPFRLLFLVLLVVPFLVLADETLPSFGKGKTKVRLYTDYFCGPCAGIEAEIEPILKELVENNLITLTFIDVPVHRYTPLYARYFIYAIQKTKGIEGILRIRSLLFTAAGRKLTTGEELQQFLTKHGVELEVVDVKAFFESYNRLLKEDEIKATPTCVIIGTKPERSSDRKDLEGEPSSKIEKKQTFSGSQAVVQALKDLAKR